MWPSSSTSVEKRGSSMWSSSSNQCGIHRRTRPQRRIFNMVFVFKLMWRGCSSLWSSSLNQGREKRIFDVVVIFKLVWNSSSNQATEEDLQYGLRLQTNVERIFFDVVFVFKRRQKRGSLMRSSSLNDCGERRIFYVVSIIELGHRGGSSIYSSSSN